MHAKVMIVFLIIINSILLGWILLHTMSFALLQPAGTIAVEEKNLIVFAIFLGLAIVIPTVLLIFFVAFRYRADNKKSYAPDWTGNKRIKFFFWAIPSVVVLLLAITTWKATHQLDPYKSLPSKTPAMTIQVIALSWKWLFIYPKQNIATVNFVEFPINTPIYFELTADAPMNSFWIPRLGGQMYAMAGMQTQLHLLASQPGDYNGTEVEINGEGYANMRFTARASLEKDFNTWAQSIKQSPYPLTQNAYDNLAKPSENTPVTFYSSIEKDLYNGIMMKYMVPKPTGPSMEMK